MFSIKEYDEMFEYNILKLIIFINFNVINNTQIVLHLKSYCHL